MKRLLLFITLSFSVFLGMAQTRVITGKVTDENGNAIPNASVTVKETQTGVSTDASGNYSLTVDNRAKTLVYSYVGKTPEEISIGNKASINVTLKLEETTMKEVVIVAYGTQNQKKVTGAISKVDGSELENKPFTSVDQMLQGKVAGLLSTSPTGQPGGIQQVRIRGIGSVTAGAAPLYVVDGVPINSGDFTRNTNTSNALAGINPNDIESVTVLKDAASASIYGSRAGNGVILINTKKGRAGKSKIRIDSEFGVGNTGYLNDISKPLNRDEYFMITTEGLVNAGATQAQINSILNTLGINNGADEDWVDNVTRQGTTQNINAAISGGDPKTTFYTSVGYMNQKAVIIGSDFERYTGTFNIKHKATEKLSVGLNATGAYIEQNSPTQSSAFRNPVVGGFWLRPSQNAYNADGTLNISATTFNQIFNPLAIEEYDYSHMNNVKLLANLNADYQFYKDLKFTTKFGIDHMNIEEEQYYNPFFGDARTVGGRIWNFDTRVSNWVWSNLLNYRHDFLNSRDLQADLTVGYEAQKSKTYSISARGEGVPLVTTLPLPTPSSPSQATGARSDYSFVSLLSMLQLNYQNKFSLSGSVRRDGSSRFGSNNKYGTFWSVGAAWNLEQEAFMQNITLINALKLRASYGVNGNADIGNYTWKGTYIFNAPYNQIPGSAPNQVDNADLTWELNKPFNVGIDVSILKNRITVNADYYVRVTEDVIINDPLSRTSGFNSVSANIGTIENRGFEFQVNAIPVQTQDFTWDITFNIALNKNEVTSLRNNADILALPFIRRVGEDYQSIYTRLWAGVDPATGNPLWYTDGTMKATTSNVTQVQRDIIGSASPKGFGSFATSVAYKGFSLSGQFNYQYGNLVYDQWGFIGWSDGFNPQLNRIRKQLERWQKPGDITNVPKYVYGGALNSNAESSRWYYKGDYIRLRDVTLSYDLPKSLISRIKMDNVRFYVRGTNLWTKAFDDGITFDPEQPINGTNDMQVLIQRTVSFGLTLGF